VGSVNHFLVFIRTVRVKTEEVVGAKTVLMLVAENIAETILRRLPCGTRIVILLNGNITKSIENRDYRRYGTTRLILNTMFYPTIANKAFVVPVVESPILMFCA